MNIIFDNGIEAAYKAIHEEGKSRSAPCPNSDKSWYDGKAKEYKTKFAQI
jgi:hypothetical protein